MQSEFEFILTEVIKILVNIAYVLVFFMGGAYAGYIIGRVHGRDDD
jgi:hypothetical protein